MIIPYTSITFEPISLILGIALVIFVFVGYWLGKKIFGPKKKYNFESIKERVKEGHEGLDQANKVFQEIYELFGEIENANR